jgi:hypothetical protein
VNTVDYVRAHKAVTKSRGPASDQACVECGGAAQDWSYDHTDPAPLTNGEGGGPYSNDVSRYVPRCKVCHYRFDRETDPLMEGRIVRRAAAAGEGVQRHISEKGLGVFVAAGRRAAARRRCCLECQKVCSPGSMAMHQKASGHTGWKDL